ncbi:MAG: 6-phosphogluconate dehydrogenase [Actinomycetota bacterium]|jgi:6-phosphogluconate dehydrogenase
MRLAMLGLGRMGAGMSRRLMQAGHEVVGFDLNPEAVADLVKDGSIKAESVEDAIKQLEPPRVVWLMLPAGTPTQDTIDHVAGILRGGDIVIDGGNSRYTDAVARAAALQLKGIHFLDAGVSGGIWGLENGFCLMVGGVEDAVEVVRPAFEALAPPNGFAHVGPAGAGHYVKMVHNGIEYGLMQAYAEGFELMNAATEFKLDLHQIADLWRNGSVVRSWLLDLAEKALDEGSGFEEIQPVVADSGEGRWTIQDAIDRAVPLPVITSALYTRFASRDVHAFAPRLLAALRNQFGGHPVLVDDQAEHRDPKS